MKLRSQNKNETSQESQKLKCQGNLCDVDSARPVALLMSVPCKNAALPVSQHGGNHTTQRRCRTGAMIKDHSFFVLPCFKG